MQSEGLTKTQCSDEFKDLPSGSWRTALASAVIAIAIVAACTPSFDESAPVSASSAPAAPKAP